MSISGTTLSLLFACWVILQRFCRLLICKKNNFSKHTFRNTIRVSNSVNPWYIVGFVGPDLVLNCWQKLSEDNRIRLLQGKSKSLYICALSFANV